MEANGNKVNECKMRSFTVTDNETQTVQAQPLTGLDFLGRMVLLWVVHDEREATEAEELRQSHVLGTAVEARTLQAMGSECPAIARSFASVTTMPAFVFICHLAIQRILVDATEQMHPAYHLKERTGRGRKGNRGPARLEESIAADLKARWSLSWFVLHCVTHACDSYLMNLKFLLAVREQVRNVRNS